MSKHYEVFLDDIQKFRNTYDFFQFARFDENHRSKNKCMQINWCLLKVK